MSSKKSGCNEVTVIVKDVERTYRQKFLVYEQFCLSNDDPVLKMCIESALNNFQGEPDDIQVKAFMVVR